MPLHSTNYQPLLTILLAFCMALGTSPGFAQEKPEILLVGVFHDFPDSQQCNWKQTYEKLLRYQSDQIAIEYNLPSDTASLVHFLGKGYLHFWDSTMMAWEGQRINPTDSVARYLRLLAQADNPAHRLQLWKYYHLQADIGNRDYQTYIMAQDWERYAQKLDTTQAWGRFLYARQQATVRNRKNGEFFNLVFPLAQQRGMPYLYPTDDKVTYPAQSDAYGGFADALEGTKDWEQYNVFWEEFVAAENEQKANCTALEFVNSAAWLDKTDYGQARILAHLNNPHYAEYVRVWYKRNESIARRIVAASRQAKSKRMAVFYGYMHVFPVKRFLEQQGYTVKLIGDIL